MPRREFRNYHHRAFFTSADFESFYFANLSLILKPALSAFVEILLKLSFPIKDSNEERPKSEAFVQ